MNRHFIIIIGKKELKDILRDKRAVFISIIIPIILFPLIFSAMNANLKKASGKIEKNLTISIIGESKLLGSYLEQSKNISIHNYSDPIIKLKKGRVYAIVHFPPNCDQRIITNKKTTITIIVDNTRNASLASYTMLAAFFKLYSNNLIPDLKQKNIMAPLSIQKQTLETSKIGNSKLALSILLPLLLIIFTATSPLAVATDLGAGEKERGTLEPLLVSPPARLDLLLGKLVAISIIGTIGVVSFIAGVIISFAWNPDFFGKTGITLTLTSVPIIIIICVTFILIIFFGSIELALSIFARSSKEAQIFFIPILMISLSCGYGVTLIDPKNIDNFYWHMPLINICLLIKELSLNIVSIRHIFITLFWAGLYIIIAFLFSLKMFFSEKVLFRSK